MEKRVTKEREQAELQAQRTAEKAAKARQRAAAAGCERGGVARGGGAYRGGARRGDRRVARAPGDGGDARRGTPLGG